MAKRKQRDDDYETETSAEPKIGHNSNLNAGERKKLGGFVSEIEAIEEKQRELNAERGGIYKAAKEAGYDTKALRHLIRIRRMDRMQREAFEAAVDAYALALGDFVSTPLGAAMAPQPEA